MCVFYTLYLFQKIILTSIFWPFFKDFIQNNKNTHFLIVFKEENVFGDVDHNEYIIFYVISHEKLKCEYHRGRELRR